MPNAANLTPGVITIAGIALFITGLSIYVSRVYLPMKIKAAYLKSITALAAAVETRESGTVGHAQRVAAMAVAVARRLAVAGRELERIEYAALLRDIGKANVPQSLLTNTKPLTDEEWRTVQNHAVLGADMASAVPFLAYTADIIRHHHECWDGTGYPDNLKGNDIPLASRILCVTSDFDAMISERPYHLAPMGLDEALEEIKAGSGIKYDPQVVEAFFDVYNEEAENLDRNKAA